MRKILLIFVATVLFAMPKAYADDTSEQYLNLDNSMGEFTPKNLLSNGEEIGLTNGNLSMQWKDALVRGRNGMDLYFTRSLNVGSTAVVLEEFTGVFDGAKNHSTGGEVILVSEDGKPLMMDPVVTADGDLTNITYENRKIIVPSLGLISAESKKTNTYRSYNKITYSPTANGWDTAWAPFRGIIILTNVSPNQPKRTREVLLVYANGALESLGKIQSTGNVLLSNVINDADKDKYGWQDPLENTNVLAMLDSGGKNYQFERNFSEALRYQVTYSYGCGWFLNRHTCYDNYSLDGWKVESFVLKEYSDGLGAVVGVDNPVSANGDKQTVTQYYISGSVENQIKQHGKSITRIVNTDSEEWSAPGGRTWILKKDVDGRVKEFIDPESNSTSFEYNLDPAIYPQVRKMGWNELKNPTSFVQIKYPSGGMMRYEIFDSIKFNDGYIKYVIATEIPDQGDQNQYLQKYYSIYNYDNKDTKEVARTNIYGVGGEQIELSFIKKFGQLLLKQKKFIANGQQVLEDYEWSYSGTDPEKPEKGSVDGVSSINITRDGVTYNSRSVVYDVTGRTTAISDALKNKVNYSYQLPLETLQMSLSPGTALPQTEVLQNLRQKNVIASISKSVGNGHYKVATPHGGYDRCDGIVPFNKLTGSIRGIEEGTTLTEISKIEYCYNTFGNIKEVYEGEDASTPSYSLSYDENNIFVTSKTTDTGKVTKYIYDANTDLITSIVYPSEAVTSYTYDKLGRVTSVTFGDSSIKHEYSPNKIHTVLHDGSSEKYFTVNKYYDGLGFLVKEDKNGNIKTYSYDEWGRLESVTYPDGKVNKLEYDGFGRLIGKYLHGLEPIKYSYSFNTTSAFLGNGLEIYRQERDLLGRVISEIKDFKDLDENGQPIKTVYEYDSLNNITKIITRGNLSISNAIDYSANTITRTYPGDDKIDIKNINDFGSITNLSSSDNLGNAIDTTLGYDSSHRLETINFPSVNGAELNDVTLKYGESGTNSYGRLKEITDHYGTTEFWYGENGAVEGVGRTLNDLGQQYKFNYSKDIFGNIVSVGYPHGLVIYYILDEQNRVKEVRKGSEFGLKIATLDHYLDGNVENIKYGNGVTTKYSYDLAGRVTKITTYKGDKYYLEDGYEYDERGRKTKVTHLDGSFVSYSYDALNQLIKAEYYKAGEDKPFDSQEYKYDLDGNRIFYKDSVKEVTYTVENNKLKKVTVNGGNNVVTEYTYKLGSVETEKETRHGKTAFEKIYAYDNDRHLLNVTVKDYTGVFNVVSDYGYDSSGRRESVTEGGKTTYFGYGESLDPLVEINGKGEVESANIYIGPLRLASIKGDKLNIFHSDELGNTLKVTDDSGEVVQSVRYDPFGNINFLNGPSDNNYLFAGKSYDRATGLIYFGARYYDPTLGRYLSLDPLAQGTNHYIYVNNDPLVKRDIFGLWGFGSSGMDGPGGGEGGEIEGPSVASSGMEGGGVDPAVAALGGILVNTVVSFLGISNDMSFDRDMMALVLSSDSGSEANGRYSNKRYDERMAKDNCNNLMYLCSDYKYRENPLGDAIRRLGDAIKRGFDSLFSGDEVPDDYNFIRDLVQYDPVSILVPLSSNSVVQPDQIIPAVDIIVSPSTNLSPTISGGGGILSGSGVGLPSQPPAEASNWQPKTEFPSKPLNAGAFYEQPDKPSASVQVQHAGNNSTEAINSSGDPVMLHSGDLVQDAVDMKIPGRGIDYEFKRTYRSRILYNGPLGYNWDHNYNKRLIKLASGNIARYDGDARFDIYLANDDGTFTSPTGRFDVLTKQADDTYKIREDHGTVYLYGNDGFIGSITDANGNSLQFSYTNVGDEKLLSAVTDTVGRKIDYSYLANGKLKDVADFSGRKISFTYDADLDLVVVDPPSGKKTTYTYSSGYAEDKNELNHNLISAADAKGQVYLYNEYSVFDRVVKQRFGEYGWFQFDYRQLTGNLECNKEEEIAQTLYRTKVIDRSGNVTAYDFNCQGNTLKSEEFTRSVRAGDPESYVTKHAYNLGGQTTSTTYPAGNGIEYKYDKGNLLEVKRGKDDPIVTIIVYEPTFNKPVSITNGFTTNFTYDDKGNIIKIERPQNLIKTFAYNSYGQPTKMVNEAGTETNLTYNDSGYLVQTDNVGSVARNAVGDVTSFTDANGHTTQFTVNSAGLITQKTDPLGVITKYHYDLNNNLTKIEKQFSTLFEYNMLDRPILKKEEVSNGHYAVTEYQYDLNENLVRVVQPEGNSVFIKYDERDLPYQITKGYQTAEASTTSIFYDGNKDPVFIFDGNGNLTRYVYDEFDRRISEIDPLNNETKFEYNILGNVTKVEKANTVRDLTYDEIGRLISMNDNGRTFGYKYDPIDKIIEETNPLGNKSLYTYDSLGRRLTATDSANDQIAYSYDNVGNLLSDNLASYEYDSSNRLVKKVDKEGGVIRYENGDCSHSAGELSPFSCVTKITDPNGNITNFEYDGLGRLTKKTEELGIVTTFTWDDDSRLVSATDANGNVSKFNYDPLNRKSAMIMPDGYEYSISYDKNSNPHEFKMPNGYAVNFTYDAGNNLLKREALLNGTSKGFDEFAYDALGRMLSFKTPSPLVGEGGGEGLFQYDAFNNLVVSNQNGNAIVRTFDLANSRTSLSYPSGFSATEQRDPIGRLTGLVDPAIGSLAGVSYSGLAGKTGVAYRNGTSGTFAYDNVYRPTKVDWKNVGVDIANYDLGYDNNGNVLQDGAHNFAYDKIDRLTNADGKAYSYDKLHNFTEHAINNLNQYTDGFIYDENGNLIQDSKYQYIYNWRNLITKVYSVSDGSLVAEYQYDAFGRRTAKFNPVAGEITNYIYDGWQILEERDEYDTVKASYVYSGLDEPVAMMKNGATYFYHYNYNGNIDAITNNAGQIIERYEYEPYGKVAIKDGTGNPLVESQIENPFYFTGAIYDSETGLYNLRNRYYNPELGRFMSRDPLGYVDSMNLYAYVGNNPVNRVDSYGLLWATWHFRVTFWAAMNSGYGIVDSAKLGWGSVAVDFADGAQSSTPDAVVQHAMATELQNTEQAREATKIYIQANINNGNLAGAIHATQDLATPAHNGQTWTGFDFTSSVTKHVLGDIFPSLNTIDHAYQNTLQVFYDAYQKETLDFITADKVARQTNENFSTRNGDLSNWLINQLSETMNKNYLDNNYIHPKKRILK